MYSRLDNWNSLRCRRKHWDERAWFPFLINFEIVATVWFPFSWHIGPRIGSSSFGIHLVASWILIGIGSSRHHHHPRLGSSSLLVAFWRRIGFIDNANGTIAIVQKVNGECVAYRYSRPSERTKILPIQLWPLDSKNLWLSGAENMRAARALLQTHPRHWQWQFPWS